MNAKELMHFIDFLKNRGLFVNPSKGEIDKDRVIWEYLQAFKPNLLQYLPDSNEIRMKAREMDEKDFEQWMFEIEKQHQ